MPVSISQCKLLLRGSKLLRDRELEAQLNLAMLRTALAIVFSGVGALDQFPTPYSDGPFGLTNDNKSFELKSKLVVDQKPVQLRFRGTLPK